MALSDLVSRTKKKFDDFFAPAPQMRVRDVVREAPQAIKSTVQAVKTGGLAGLGKKISDSLATGTDYFAPTPKVRVRDFVRELPTGIGETANKVMQDATRFGISVKELPETFRSGKATGKFYDTPVGRLNSYQSEAQNRVERGDPLWKAIGNPAAETVLFGAPDATAVGKSIVKSPVVTAVGKKILGKTLQNEAKDIVADGGLKVAQLVRPYIFGKKGVPYRSKLMRGLSKPGLTVEDVSQNTLRPNQPDIREGSSDFDLVARERYNIPALKKISFGGSDRDVYDLGDGRVIKIVKTARGIDQNRYSSDYYAEGAGLIPKTIEVGKNYVVKEKVLPPTDAVKKMVSELKKLNNLTTGGFYNRDAYYQDVQKAIDILNRYGYSGDDLMNYGDILWGDIQAIRNWGTTIDGKPILLDEGTLNGRLVSDAMASVTGGTKNLLDPEFREIYDKSRAAKKAFGDKDAKTMYSAVPGVGAGLETDEEGNVRIDPMKAAMGVAGMSVARRLGDDFFTPKMWAELNKLAGKSVRTAAEDARYFDLENRLYQLPMEDQMKLLGADDVSNEIIDTTGEIQHQFDTFVSLFKNPKLRNPKVKNAIMDGDLVTLKRELSSRGVMTPNQVDNMLYDQEKSGDELLDFFKERLKQENPELMMGKKIARNLGTVDETESVVGKKFMNEAEKFMAEAKESSPFIVFRSSSSPFDAGKVNADYGLPTARSRGVAEIFNRGGRSIEELEVDGNAKILRSLPEGFNAENTVNFDLAVVKYARENGYDAVDLSKDVNAGIDELRIVNPRIVKARPKKLMLGSGKEEAPLMLPMGRDFTSKEAKRIMQKSGMAVPFKDTLKPSGKPLIFGETGADFRRIGVDAKVPTEKVRVDYNFTDPEAPENLSTVRKWITSGETILNKMGSAGKEAVRRMGSQRKAEDMLRGSYHLDVEDAIQKLPENERFMVADILDGQTVENAPERVTTAAAKMRALLDEVADEASAGGFTIRTPDGEVPFKRMENYYPRQYDFDELKKGEMHEKALEHMVATGQARNKAEAEKMLNDFIMANTERRSGNLENARMFDVPGYERDPLVALKRYTASVAKRLTEAKYFGKKDEMMASLINKIAQNNGDYNEAQRIFDFHVNGMPKNEAVSAVTKFNVATKLDLAFITNASQSLNTITKAGLMNTIFGAARGFTKEGRRLAKQVGAVQDSHIYEQESGTFDSIAKAIMIPFRIVENFNRRTAANTGVIRAKELIERAQKGSRYAIREMKRLGLDPSKKELTENDLLTAAYEMSRQTQFKVDSIDIPPAWKTPLGRLITQFKSFSFMQTKFIRDQIADELRHGNVMPLLRFVPLAIGASMATQHVRNILTGRDPEDPTKNADIRQWDKWLKGFGTIPTDLIIQGKFLKDTYDSEYLTAMKKLSRVLGTTLGATAGTIGSYLAAIESISSTEEKNKQLGIEKEKQDPYLDLKRQATGDVPVVGEYLKNTLYPYKKSDKTEEEKAQTKAYFDTKEKVMAGMTTKERAALDALPATNPLNPWSKIQKYTTYRTSPAVFEAKRQLALTEAKGDLSKVDPLFRYKYEAVMPYLAYQSLLPNARERKALREKNPIIMQLGKERSDFFDANPIDPEFAQPNIPGLLPYPAPDEDTSKLMDAKSWKHPKVQAYFDARDAWESQVYALAGVPLTQDGFGFGKGGKKPKKPDYASLPFEDLNDFLTKRGIDVSPRAQFGTGVPISKPTFSMPTRTQVSKAKTTERKRNKIGVSFRGRQLV